VAELGSFVIPVREQLICLVLAFAWDRWGGEPPAVVHPVVWLGRLIGWLAKRKSAPLNPGRDLLQGIFIAITVPLVAWWLTRVALLGLGETPWLRLLVGTWLLKSTFALHGLGKAAHTVRDALEAGDLTGARVGLRSLCSRDASALSEPELAAAAVESVAENASDSVVAPLFFHAWLGLPGAMAYRAVNTADAMIGYRGAYEYLGKAAARLDDFLNLVPARLTAALLLLAGAVHGADVRAGWRIWRRDGGKTESPNAGRPMAVMAGLLGVRLEKAGHYGLGDARRPIDAQTITRAVRIVRTLGIIALAAGAQGVVWLAR
jgi:adenosylcobinamide-phosphate synthase